MSPKSLRTVVGTAVIVSMVDLAMATPLAPDVQPESSATIYVGDILSQPADGTPAWHADYAHTLVANGEQLFVGSPGGVEVWQSHPLLGYHRRQMLPGTASVAGLLSPFAMAAVGPWMALGRPFAVPGAPNGRVMLFRRSSDGTWSLAAEILPSGEGPSFGSGVAFDGVTLVIGHPGRINGLRSPAGGVEIYTLGEDGRFALAEVVAAPMTSLLPNLGFRVAVSGSTILATSNGSGAPESVAVFERSERGVFLAGTLAHPEQPAAATGFGSGLAMEGAWCAISAPNTTVNGVVNAGQVFVYERDERGWTQRAQFAGTHANEFVGSVAIDGGLFAIGEMGSTGPNGGAGRVRLFELRTPLAPVGTLDLPLEEVASVEAGRVVAMADGRLAFGFRNLSWSSNTSGGVAIRRVAGAALDNDGDGVPNGIEATIDGAVDCDHDLVPDGETTAIDDCDGDTVPDVCTMTPLLAPSGSGAPMTGGMYTSIAAANSITLYLARVEQPLDQTGSLVGVTAKIGCVNEQVPPHCFIAIYRDPNSDGDPVDAELVGQFAAAWPGPWGTTQRAMFPPIDVGGPGATYFIGFGAPVTTVGTGIGPHADPGVSLPSRSWRIWAPMSLFDVHSPLSNATVTALGPPMGTYNVWAAGLYANALDLNGDGRMDACACIGDLDRNGVVEGGDVALLLGAWETPDADLDGDGSVTASDIAVLLGAWGACAGR